MTGKVALVTGAGGFIGRWSAAPLLAAGFEVHAVVGRVPGAGVPAQLRGAVCHHADLLDADAIALLVDRVRPSHLLHFAWIATPGVYWTSADNQRWLAAGAHLLRAFQGAGGRRAVMAGTCAEYDWSQAGVCREDASPLADAGGGPVAAYARCKLAMARTLAQFAQAHRLSSAWGRIFFQFGPHEHPQRLVASVILNLLRGLDAPCTHGRQIRSFLHVSDVGSAFAALLQGNVEGPVNIGSGEPVSLGWLLQRIGLQIGRPELVRLGARPAPPAEPPVLIPAVERLRREVGWRPNIGLDQAIADTISWWRDVSSCGGG